MVEYDEIAYWPNKVSLFLLNIVAYCDHLSFPSVEKSALWLSPCMWLGFPLIFFYMVSQKACFWGLFLPEFVKFMKIGQLQLSFPPRKHDEIYLFFNRYEETKGLAIIQDFAAHCAIKN